MEDKSILDQIISNKKAEEVAKLDAVEIISNLFGELNERERDVISRRFGLHGKTRETLEGIGGAHNLTRERIRQIETSGVKKLRQLEKLDNFISGLKSVITQLLEEHGGLLEREYLLNNLVNFSVGSFKPESDEEKLHKSHLEFLISKLLHDNFEEIKDSKHFKHSFKLKYQALDHIEALAQELVEKIKEVKDIFSTEDVVGLAKELESYKANKDKFSTPNTIDVSNILRRDKFEENAELINNHKIIYSILQASKHIEQNKFGHWGIHNWREIKPKTINDKIFLILKNHGKPVHFAEIADKINEMEFDNRKANAATVHNELILDDKYILVGRGLYGLKEWGYKKGTVADIIDQILKEMENKEMTKEEIIEKVLEQRMVKKATIILALMDRDKFEKVDGRYRLKK